MLWGSIQASLLTIIAQFVGTTFLRPGKAGIGLRSWLHAAVSGDGRRSVFDELAKSAAT
ncbi:MAG: hypothetical protein R2706_04595 [Acidimicrobiales bacterium]